MLAWGAQTIFLLGMQAGPGGVQILRHLLTTSGNQLPRLQTGLTNAPTSQGCEDGCPSMPHVVAPRVMGTVPSSPQNLSPEPGLGSRRVQGCGGLSWVLAFAGRPWSEHTLWRLLLLVCLCPVIGSANAV